MLQRNVTQPHSHFAQTPPVAALPAYLFGFRVLLLCSVCFFVRQTRVCRLSKKVFCRADILWLVLDTVLCADPFATPPLDQTEQLSSLYYSARLSLFLYVSTPLFLLAAESGRRGLAVLVAVFMCMQRFTIAMIAERLVLYSVAGLSLRPLWIASSLPASCTNTKPISPQNFIV